MQQMTEEIQENCNILADAINFDMPEENDTVAGSSLPKTSTPKRPFRSIENKDSHTAKKVKQYGSHELNCSSTNAQTVRLQNMTAPTLQSTTTASTGGSCTVAPTGNSGSSSSDKRMNRLRQLQQKRRRSNDSKQESTVAVKDIALIDKEMQRICNEHEFILERRALLKIQQTNARLEQIKLCYEIKELERKNQVPVDKAVENMVDLDLSISTAGDEAKPMERRV